MKAASVTNVKVMNSGHDMWPMKFGSYSHEPVRIKYVLGSATYYLYYNFGKFISFVCADPNWNQFLINLNLESI